MDAVGITASEGLNLSHSFPDKDCVFFVGNDRTCRQIYSGTKQVLKDINVGTYNAFTFTVHGFNHSDQA